MLKKYAQLYFPDENPTGGNPSEPTTDVSQPSADTTPSSGVAEGSDSGEPKSVDDIIDKLMPASQPGAKDGEKSAVQELNQTPAQKPPEVKKPEGEKETAPTAPVQKDKDGKELPPFHEHPRWKEMVAERDELKQFRSQVEPVVQEWNRLNEYRQTFNINNEQFAAALEIAALLNSDPAGALAKLKPVMEALQPYDGSALDPDLQQEVEDENLSRDRAEEIMRYRAQMKAGEVRQKATAQQHQRAMAQAMDREMVSWEQATRSTDPDFRPKASEEEADGKYELTRDKLRAMWMQKQPTSAAEAVAMCKQAYDLVNKSLARFIPPKPPVKNLGSGAGVSQTKSKEPESVEDVLNAVMAKHGI